MVKGVIFDLDGVICSTDEFHYKAWKRICDERSIPFDRKVNNLLRGVSRKDSLEIILKEAGMNFSDEEKDRMLKEKNDIYVSELSSLSSDDIAPGFMDFLSLLKKKGIKTAVGSSSKNTKRILTHLGLINSFDAIADGTEITRSKPDPEVFLLAAQKIHTDPKDCAVIEDAEAGIKAAKAGGMLGIAIKDAKKSPLADIRADSFKEIASDLGLID